MTWVREALSPRTREKVSEAELAEARKAAAGQNQLNVFEALPEVSSEEEAASTKRTKKHDHVRPFCLVYLASQAERDVYHSSTSTLPLTSRSHIGSLICRVNKYTGSRLTTPSSRCNSARNARVTGSRACSLLLKIMQLRKDLKSRSSLSVCCHTFLPIMLHV